MTETGAVSDRTPSGRRMSHSEIVATAKGWAAQHEDATVEGTIRALGLDSDTDARIIVAGVIARVQWNREGVHIRQPGGRRR